MKKREVVLGELYRVSDRGKTIIVRLTRERRDGKPGWEGLDVASQRPVKIAAAARIQTRCTRQGKPLPPAEAPAAPAADQEAAGKQPSKAAPGSPRSAGKRRAKAAAKAAPAKRAKAAAKAAPAKRAKGRRRGILDIAAELLAASPVPRMPSELVTQALDGKLWSTNGKTPAATLYAAIIREISGKGDQSRFRKTGPNTFAITAVGKAAAAGGK